MFQNVDYYALLGVGREASESEMRERFRALARNAHPDRAALAEKAEAEVKFQELTLTVTSESRTAVRLYEQLGFKPLKTFTAGVWPR